MKWRQYLTRFGAGSTIVVTGFAGCGSPEEDDEEAEEAEEAVATDPENGATGAQTAEAVVV